MKWRGRRGSRNIVDRRRSGIGGAAGGIGGVGLLAVLVIGYFLGVDVTPLLDDLAGGGSTGAPAQVSPEDEAAAEFVSVTLADTEEVWTGLFERQVGEAYAEPELVLFNNSTQSACGGASAATGPFYCPGDRRIYLDTAFFGTLSRQLGARGDFAAAYVVAHEVGHHVQNELGILGQTSRMRAQMSPEESNALSVRVELQADCFAGIWARQAEAQFGSLEPGDVEEAMTAAARIGDDALQRGAGQAVRPESFNHGTRDQRQRWFARGYDGGDIVRCDTFGAAQL